MTGVPKMMKYYELFDEMQYWLRESQHNNAQCCTCGKVLSIPAIELLAFRINPLLKIFCERHTPKRRFSGKHRQFNKWVRDCNMVKHVGIEILSGKDDCQILSYHKTDGLTKEKLFVIRNYFDCRAVAITL